MFCTCGSFSPGFPVKYNTYSLMDDTTDKIVHFESIQVSLHDIFTSRMLLIKSNLSKC